MIAGIKSIVGYGSALWALRCPKCGAIEVLASEWECLPDYSTCDCRQNGLFEICKIDGKTILKRRVYPKFTCEIAPGKPIDIKKINLDNTYILPAEFDRAVLEAQNFIIRNNCKKIE